MNDPRTSLAGAQQVALVVLRTLIGWHILYEGWVKLWSPGWSPDGTPMRAWTSAGYLRAATGPLAGLFRAMGDSGSLKAIDVAVIGLLLFAGLSLTLGLFTQAGCAAALLLLTLFYVSAVPTRGVAQPGNEGTYLLVNKTLIEAAAVAVLFAFRTGRIAGLDLLLPRRRERAAQELAA